MTLPEIDLTITPQPIQRKLFRTYEHSKATKIGFGGPRGGTKSHSSDILMLARRTKYPGTNGLFVMRVYSDMMDIHIRPLLETYPELELGFNKQEMILKLSNGSYIRYLSGESLDSFTKRKGRGFADVMIDQSELFSKDEIEFLYTINRTVKPGITPKTLLCFNPGNIGHAYHKRVFYDKIYEGKEKPEEFAYIEAKGWDNAYWSINELAEEEGIEPKDLTPEEVQRLIRKYHTYPEEKRFNMYLSTNYGRTLDGLPEHKRRAELFGDMEVFEGMFFEDYRYGHHVIEGYRISPHRQTIAGLDYGNVTVLEILQRDSEGTIIVAGELYLSDLTNPSDRANAIADYLLERELYRLEIIYDTDMEISQLSNVGYDKTPISIFRDVLKQRMGEKAPKMRCVNKKSLDKNKPYRIVVNDAVKNYLRIRKVCKVCGGMIQRQETECKKCKVNETRQISDLYISRECKYLNAFFSEAIYDLRDPGGGDFDRSQIPKKDHPYDGFKYGFMELQAPRIKEEDPRPQWLKNMERQERLRIANDFMAK